jgi:hypothetical protein
MAEYYDCGFLHDQEKLTRGNIREEATPVAIANSNELSADAEAVKLRLPYCLLELPC